MLCHGSRCGPGTRNNRDHSRARGRARRAVDESLNIAARGGEGGGPAQARAWGGQPRSHAAETLPTTARKPLSACLSGTQRWFWWSGNNQSRRRAHRFAPNRRANPRGDDGTHCRGGQGDNHLETLVVGPAGLNMDPRKSVGLEYFVQRVRMHTPRSRQNPIWGKKNGPHAPRSPSPSTMESSIVVLARNQQIDEVRGLVIYSERR